MKGTRLHEVAACSVTAALILTPLCGLWFSCGCDWPWHRLFLGCNAMLANAPEPHCPWCVHPWAAAWSIGLGAAASFLAITKAPSLPVPPGAAMLFRHGIGLAAFVALLAISGWLTALLIHHPSFLGMPLF